MARTVLRASAPGALIALKFPQLGPRARILRIRGAPAPNSAVAATDCRIDHASEVDHVTELEYVDSAGSQRLDDRILVEVALGDDCDRQRRILREDRVDEFERVRSIRQIRTQHQFGALPGNQRGERRGRGDPRHDEAQLRERVRQS